MIYVFALVLTIYIVFGTILALVSRRFGVKSTSEYFVAGYRLGGFLSAMTYAATTYSAFMMIGLVGYAYATGVGALGFELAYLLATILLLTLFGRHVWRLARERGWISPSEMISDLYGSELFGVTIAVIYLVALIPYISAQVIGIGRIFEGIGAGYEIGVVIAVALIFLWIVIAGVWSVVTTDAYQGLWMIFSSSALIVWLILIFIPSNAGNIVNVLNAASERGLMGITSFWSPSTFIAFTLPWIFFAITNPQVVQRIFMPASEKSLKRLIEYFAIYGFVYTIIVTIVGLLAAGLSELGTIGHIESRDLVTSILLLHLDPVFASIIYVSIVAAAISTANSIILSIVSSFVRDVFEKRLDVRDHRRSIIVARIVTSVLVVVAALVAYTKPGFIVDMAVLSSVILLPIAPITILAWLKPGLVKKDLVRTGAYIGLLTGFIIALSGAVYYGPKNAFLKSIGGAPLSAIVLLTTLSILVITMLIAMKKH